VTDPGRLAVEALKQVTAVLGKLTVEELQDLVAGRGQLVYQSAEALVPAKGSRRRSPTAPKARVVVNPRAVFDAVAAAVEIRQMATAQEVVAHLENGGFTISKLKDLALAIGPTVVLTGRKKDEIIRDIADGVAGYRQRSSAISEGAWS
jgi:hypothetical protein